ncbi:MAG: NFACT family protein [Anaerolineae bacterium]|nr:NFACT family protein [Anaerolineae bacterium]
MYLDAFTLSALVDEFLDTLVGGRVQDSIDVDETGLGLEIYAQHRRHYLYMSADHQTPRVHLVEDKLRRGLPKPKPIGLLFRRYVEGGVVTHVSQPKWERILQIDIEGPEGEVSIVVEPMERRSNILLVQNGVILECVRRVGPDENRYRVSLPAHAYVPPPPQIGKLDPTRLTAETLDGIFDQNDDPKLAVHRLLSGRLLGMSPLLAKEIVFRASRQIHLKAQDADPAALFDALESVLALLADRQWQPGIAENENGIEAFSVYPLQSIAGWHPTNSVSSALFAYYGAVLGDDAYQAAKEPVRAAIQEARAKLESKLHSLRQSLTDESEREFLRHSGELILAYQYAIEKGQTELKAQYDLDQPELVITIDPKLTPLENAQQYFSRYEKAKRALAGVPELIEDAATEVAYLDQLAIDLDMASNWPDIDEVQQALQAKGYWQGKRTGRIGGGKSAPLRIVTPDGFVLWVGRNSRQNEMVTFDKGSGADLWLHARDVPGAHVIIKFDGREIPEPVIEQAAQIAAYYSSRKADSNVIVDVTPRKYVKKIRGAGPGMVTYRNETTRTVQPQEPET